MGMQEYNPKFFLVHKKSILGSLTFLTSHVSRKLQKTSRLKKMSLSMWTYNKNQWQLVKTHWLRLKNSYSQIVITDKIWLKFLSDEWRFAKHHYSVYYFSQSSKSTYQILENTL